MTPTNDQIFREAVRRREAVPIEQRLPVQDYVIEVVRENWKPPEPVDPDLVAYREWFAADRHAWINRADVIAGNWDTNSHATAYLAGARMAREQERERARGLVDRISDLVERVTHDGKQDYVTGVNAGEMISARVVLAKCRGEA